MRSKRNTPAAEYVTGLIANEALRGLGSLAALLLLVWLFRWPLLDFAWGLGESLGLRPAASGLDLSQPAARRVIYGLPRGVPGLELRESLAETEQKISRARERLDFSADAGDLAWPAHNMLVLPAPYGCRHWYVITDTLQGFHLYRFRTACGHEIDLIPDMQGGRELADPRPLVEYYRDQRCAKCRPGEEVAHSE
ncbi:hypothetical protein IT575_14575 [bacterium]|nr:hypothetical protein [bacterium]